MNLAKMMVFVLAIRQNYRQILLSETEDDAVRSASDTDEDG